MRAIGTAASSLMVGRVLPFCRFAMDAMSNEHCFHSVLIPTHTAKKISYMVFRREFLQDLRRNSTK